MTADHKYFLNNREELPEPIQMDLPQKSKVLSEIIAAYLKFTPSFEHFEKKMIFIDYVYPKILTPKGVVL